MWLTNNLLILTSGGVRRWHCAISPLENKVQTFSYFPLIHNSIRDPLTCVCGWWSNMSIWISWVEVEGVLDILLFCTIDLTFVSREKSISQCVPRAFMTMAMMMMLSTDSSLSLLLVFWGFCSSPLTNTGDDEAADVSELAGEIMATAASIQPIALHTGAPQSSLRNWRNFCFQNKMSLKEGEPQAPGRVWLI